MGKQKEASSANWLPVRDSNFDMSKTLAEPEILSPVKARRSVRHDPEFDSAIKQMESKTTAMKRNPTLAAEFLGIDPRTIQVKTPKRTNQRIVEEAIKKIKPPQEGSLIQWDREIPGFGVRLTAKGATSFILDYRIAGRQKRYTFGRWPEMSATAARLKAGQLRAKIPAGHAPLEDRIQSRVEPTVGQLAEEYLKSDRVRKHRPTTARNEEQRIENIIRPALGRLRLSSVGKRDVANLHFSLKATPYQANRVRSLLSAMFNFAIEQKLMVENPAKGIEKFHEDKRENWLTVEQIRAFRSALDGYQDQEAANVLRLLLLTGSRKSEALGARWECFDLRRGTWMKPSSSTKEKRQEYVSLNEPTIQLLKSMMPNKNPTGFLFPGTKGGCRTTIHRAWLQACKAAGLVEVEEVKGKRRHKVLKYRLLVRLHDLRHSFASHLISNGVSLQVVGKLLGHARPETTMRYSHVQDQATRAATNVMGDIYTDDEKLRAGASGQ